MSQYRYPLHFFLIGFTIVSAQKALLKSKVKKMADETCKKCGEEGCDGNCEEVEKDEDTDTDGEDE